MLKSKIYKLAALGCLCIIAADALVNLVSRVCGEDCCDCCCFGGCDCDDGCDDGCDDFCGMIRRDDDGGVTEAFQEDM